MPALPTTAVRIDGPVRWRRQRARPYRRIALLRRRRVWEPERLPLFLTIHYLLRSTRLLTAVLRHPFYATHACNYDYGRTGRGNNASLILTPQPP